MTMPITIDLINDTATKPTEGMRDAMARAEVGDEQRGEDPSVNALCKRVAGMLGMQAAIYLPSGIMINLIAILVHCRPGDEIIAAGNAHIISSEGAGASALAGAMITTIDTPNGRYTVDQFLPTSARRDHGPHAHGLSLSSKRRTRAAVRCGLKLRYVTSQKQPANEA
jgi:threonine aldolase